MSIRPACGRQVRVVDHRHQHLAGPVQRNGLLDQFAFAFEGGTFEFDLERFAENFHRVGIGVQRARDGGDQIFLLGELTQGFFDH